MITVKYFHRKELDSSRSEISEGIKYLQEQRVVIKWKELGDIQHHLVVRERILPSPIAVIIEYLLSFGGRRVADPNRYLAIISYSIRDLEYSYCSRFVVVSWIYSETANLVLLHRFVRYVQKAVRYCRSRRPDELNNLIPAGFCRIIDDAQLAPGTSCRRLNHLNRWMPARR